SRGPSHPVLNATAPIASAASVRANSRCIPMGEWCQIRVLAARAAGAAAIAIVGDAAIVQGSTGKMIYSAGRHQRSSRTLAVVPTGNEEGAGGGSGAGFACCPAQHLNP
ncbi:MAG: hypothetical protein ACPHRO_14630, partial [Nannocystaceae bacterium]